MDMHRVIRRMIPMLTPHLKEHADDGHHRKPSVCKLGRELFRLLSRVRGGQHLEAVVARCAALVVIEAAAELHETEVRGNLCPACDRHLGDGRKPIRDVGELQAGGRRQEARPYTFAAAKQDTCSSS